MAAKPLYKIGEKLYERKQHRHHVKRAFSVGISIVVALAIVLLTFSLLIKIGGLSMTSLTKITGIPVSADENGVTNVLLLGQGDETGQDLTDTIMIASIDPVDTNSVSLLSLPRDLYFLHTDTIMETEKGKLNALWRDNRILLGKKGHTYEEARLLSLKQLAEEIGNAIGIDIHHAVMVDFEAFEKAVDAIGGIDVAVPETIHDEEFPGPNYTYETFHIDAGLQKLDGKTALKYARTRSTTSDFDRSARQQQILNAASKQAKESGILRKPKKILELFTILNEHIETDLSTRQMITLGNIAKEVDKDHFVSLQLNNVNGLYGEQLWKGGILYAPPRDLFEGDSVLLPVSIPEFPVTWKQVQTLVNLFFQNRTLYLDNPRISIFNGGAKEGSARKISRELTKYGFDVVEVTNVPGRKEFPSSFVLLNNSDTDKTAKFFGSLLNVPSEEISPAWTEILAGKDNGDIAMILGEDFEFSFFQDLISL